MRRLLTAACVLLVLSASAAGVEEIALVETLEALQKVKPIKLESGWEVQLGLGDGGKESGPWLLLYCLAEYNGPGEGAVPVHIKPDGAGGRHRLGPVCFDLERLDRKKPGGRARVKSITGALKLPRHALYCQTIPGAWKGRYRLRVLGEGDTVIAEKTFTVEADHRNYWRVFAAQRERQQGDAVRYRVDRWGSPAFPRFDGHTAAVAFTRRSTKAGDETPLPGRVPEGDFWVRCNARVGRLTMTREGERPERLRSMKLSLEKDVFVVRSDPKMYMLGNLHLLARWWVNGKPKPDKEDRLGWSSHENGLVTYVNEHRVKFGLPDILGELKAGDKVGLQVMYSPNKYRIAVLAKGAKRSAMRSVVKDGVARVPMVSNRIEFVVTQQMLDARGKTEGKR